MMIFGVCLAAIFGSVSADEPADDKARAAEFLELAKAEATAYKLEDANGDRLTLQPEPILTWSNPVVGSIQGDVFVWTSKGRPEVVASFYKWYAPFTHRTNEFVSLASGSVAATREGDKVWAPSKAGVESKPIPEAPIPAKNPAQRLRQIRALALEFSANETDRKGVEREIRLLPQPIYRYENTQGDLIDGALFAFALGTDPEALLMIEARMVEGNPRWHYSLARMNSIAMKASYKGREVWNLPTLTYSSTGIRSEPYTSFIFGKVETAPPKRP
jgi:hypothetical protein